MFRFDALPARPLAGISLLVQAYRVVGIIEAPSRFEAAAARRLMPLVGREIEVELLLSRWRQAVQGEGQIVLLSGEAGVGKSRIVRGFQDRLEAAPRTVPYFCTPYHQNSALRPVVDQLERRLGLRSDDSPNARLDKLQTELAELGGSMVVHLPMLASLLCFPVAVNRTVPDVKPAQLRQHVFEALFLTLQAMAKDGPTLMTVEDAHWIDPSTEEVLGLFVEQIRVLPILLIVTHRPEYVPPWSYAVHTTSLALNRLGRSECAVLIDLVAGGVSLPDEVAAQIVAKADGIPLFVEELSRTVLDSGLLVDQGDHFELAGTHLRLGIPASLQDALMARLDRLDTGREVAQIAAVIGRSFNLDLLVAAAQQSNIPVGDAVEKLCEAGLIYLQGSAPEAIYEFKHALIRDTAYESLLKTRRQAFHACIAQVLYAQYPAVAFTQPELLAHHYSAANMNEQAASEWARAGQLAAERAAYVEAVDHFGAALASLKGCDLDAGAAQAELEILLALAPALLVIKLWSAPEVLQTYLRARDLAAESGTAAQAFAATYGLYLQSIMTGRLRQAQDFARELLEMASQHADKSLQLPVIHSL
jgi:predicted ATPase